MVTKRRKSWLGKYLDYTIESEAPELYHVFSGITVLAHALGRNVWMDRGYEQMYPGQFYTFLIGPQGLKKSSAIKIATGLLREIPSIRFMSDKLSPQALMWSMRTAYYTSQNGTGVEMKALPSVVFIEADELSVFMPKASYAEETIPLLTKLLDAKPGKFLYETKNAPPIEILDPLPGLLAGSTPEWLWKNIPESIWDGGFMSRTLTVYQEHTDRMNADPRSSKKMDRLRKELIAELMWINEYVKGEVRRTVGAGEWYKKWYEQNKLEADEKGNKGPLAAFRARKPHHLLRLASVIAVSRSHGLVIEVQDLEVALEFLSRVEFYFGLLVGQRFTNTAGAINANVLEFIERHKGYLSESDILRGCWRTGISRFQLKGILETLELASAIRVFDQKGRKFYQAWKKNKPDISKGGRSRF